MPHTSRKQSNRYPNKNGNIDRVPSLYSISGNISPSKRHLKKSHSTVARGVEDHHNGQGTENIMMGSIDKWNSSGNIRTYRGHSPENTVFDSDRDRPVAFVQPIVHRSPPTGHLTAPDHKNEFRSSSSSSDNVYALHGAAAGQCTDRPEIDLEEFDNSLFILCVVSIFINPVLGIPATFAAYRAKQAFFGGRWKAFRKWTVAAHAFSSIGFGLAAIAFGMIGIKLYHMYSGIQCFYKCSFLTNNEFNWQGFWDELNQNRGGV